MAMGFYQTIQACLTTAQDRLRFRGEALKFGVIIALVVVLALLLLLGGA